MRVRWWAALLLVGVVALGLELVGVFNSGAGEVDTYSELYWWVRDRAGWFAVPLAVGTAGFLGWLWWHLTFERRQRRLAERRRRRNT